MPPEGHTYASTVPSMGAFPPERLIDLLQEVIGIGNCHGQDLDKFQKFELTPLPATQVDALLIKEC